MLRKLSHAPALLRACSTTALPFLPPTHNTQCRKLATSLSFTRAMSTADNPAPTKTEETIIQIEAEGSRDHPSRKKEQRLHVTPLMDLLGGDATSSSSTQGKASLVRFPESAQLFPEGLCGDFHHDLEMFKRAFVCPTLLPELLQQLQRVGEGGKVEKGSRWGEEGTVLAGSSGIGKSFLLNCAVAYARLEGWIVLFAPRPLDWVTGSKAEEMGTGAGHGVVPSPVTKELFSNPKGAKVMLEQFKGLYYDKLQGIPQRREYPHGLYERNGDTSLVNIIDRGILTLPASANAVYDLRMELGLLEEHPVLIVADQMNTLYWPSSFYSMGQVVDSSEMLLPRTFRCLESDGSFNAEHAVKRGYQLYGSTAKYPLPPSAKEYEMRTPFARDGSMKKDAVESKACKSVELEPYTAEQLQLVLTHYGNCLSKETKLSPLLRYEMNNLPQHVRDAFIASPVFDL